MNNIECNQSTSSQYCTMSHVPCELCLGPEVMYYYYDIAYSNQISVYFIDVIITNFEGDHCTYIAACQSDVYIRYAIHVITSFN